MKNGSNLSERIFEKCFFKTIIFEARPKKSKKIDLVTKKIQKKPLKKIFLNFFLHDYVKKHQIKVIEKIKIQKKKEKKKKI